MDDFHNETWVSPRAQRELDNAVKRELFEVVMQLGATCGLSQEQSAKLTRFAIQEPVQCMQLIDQLQGRLANRPDDN